MLLAQLYIINGATVLPGRKFSAVLTVSPKLPQRTVPTFLIQGVVWLRQACGPVVIVAAVSGFAPFPVFVIAVTALLAIRSCVIAMAHTLSLIPHDVVMFARSTKWLLEQRRAALSALL